VPLLNNDVLPLRATSNDADASFCRSGACSDTSNTLSQDTAVFTSNVLSENSSLTRRSISSLLKLAA